MLQLSAIQWIELIASILTVWGVWLNARPSILGWPVGLVSVAMAALVYFESRLFAESGLQLFYAASSIYGWWKWHQEKEKIHDLRILKISGLVLSKGIIVGFLATVLLSALLKQFTSADLPLIDSALAAFSLVAQIWMARKYLENWLLWIIINLISVGVYVYKELWFFTGLFVILFGLAILGYVQWSKKWKVQNA